jgi:hypothetical protein
MNETSIGPARSRGRPPNRGRAPTGREHCQPAIRGGPALDAITLAVKRRWGDKQRNRDDTASSLQPFIGFHNVWWFANTKLSRANASTIASDFHWPGNILAFNYQEASANLGFSQLEKHIASQAKARDWIAVTCAGGFSWKPDRENQTSTLQLQDSFPANRRAEMSLPQPFVNKNNQSTKETRKLGIGASLARDKIISTCTGGQPWKPVRHNQTKHQRTRTPFFAARGLEFVLPFRLENNSTNINSFFALTEHKLLLRQIC